MAKSIVLFNANKTHCIIIIIIIECLRQGLLYLDLLE